jgi:hypothetical protein
MNSSSVRELSGSGDVGWSPASSAERRSTRGCGRDRWESLAEKKLSGAIAREPAARGRAASG